MASGLSASHSVPQFQAVAQGELHLAPDLLEGKGHLQVGKSRMFDAIPNDAFT